MKITVDVRELHDFERRLAKLPQDLRDQAIGATLNKVADKGKTEVGRAIRDEYVIDPDRVRNAIVVRRASARNEHFVADIDIFGSSKQRGRSLNVIHFMERKTSLAQARRRSKKKELYVVGKGGRLLPILRFTFKRGSGGKVIDGAFIGNKGRTIFRRIGKGRLPIVPVQVIDVPQMFGAKKVTARVMDRINAELPVELDRAVNFVLLKSLGR